MTASRTIRYYFTLQSPWAYLGHAQLLALAARHGARIDYRPISLAEVFPASGGLPLVKRHPARQAYRKMELQRWKARLGLDFNFWPRHWPLDVGPADRTATALVQMGLSPEPFVTLAFAGIWEKERDLADSATIAGILRESGQEPGPVMARAAAQDIVDLYATHTSQALEAGVFGSPTYWLELFHLTPTRW
jgi:2-hydroxychromene-2-carboxylate isomerase